MVNSAQILLFAATIVAPVTQVLAADVDDTWTTPGFVTCVDGLGKKPSREAVWDCHEKNKSNKRDLSHDTTTITSSTVAQDLNLLGARDTQASWKKDCESNDKLPKNFEIVTDIRANAAQYCQDLKQDVVDIGVSLIDKKLNNAVSKTAAELHGGKGVLLRMAFTLTPQGRALMASKKVTEDAYLDICTKAMTALATKDEGCTHEMHAMSLKKGHRYQVTGARSGSMNINWGDTIFGFVSNMYTKP